MVNVSQIRQVIKAMKKAVETEIYPDRKEVPKTLIFAKTDSHADDIIQIVREEYGQGNEFCKKVTYNAKDPDGILNDFRNDFNPRITVTVDMIATGTDVKPLEILLFMRDVRSKGYYEQMKGRGVRSLSYEDLHNVSKSATSDKERFVLIDAVGVEKSLKTESRPLERNPNLSMKDLLQGVAMGHRDDDTIQSLANRLTRLSKQLDKYGLAEVEKLTGKPLPLLARELLTALDPDTINMQALANAKAAGITRSAESLTESEQQTAKEQLINQACQTFDNPDTREGIESARRQREQLIDHINLDTVTYSGYSSQAADSAEKVIQSFKNFIEQHKDDIQALSFFYQQPYQRRGLTFAMLEDLHQALSKPPLLLTTEKLWSAYERLNQGNNQAAAKNTKSNSNKSKKMNSQRQLTDIISLIRFAMGLDSELKPFAEQVDAKFKKWIFRHNAQRSTAFSEQQTNWIRLIKDHIAASCSIERDDFDYSPFSDHGGLQKAWGLFSVSNNGQGDNNELDSLLAEMNQELIA